MHRYRFIATLNSDDFTWTLGEEESHHLVRTLRLKVGEIVEVTNGCGQWAVGKIVAADKTRCLVDSSVSQLQHQEAPETEVHLLIGALKPGSVDEILPGLTELGIDAVTVFMQSGAPRWSMNAQSGERWERIVTQAVKQCKRPFLPKLNQAKSLEAALELEFAGSDLALGASDTHGFVLAEDASDSLFKALVPISPTLSQTFEQKSVRRIILACGSEKGLGHDELLVLNQNKFHSVSIGTSILRAKTAALVATGLVRSAFP